MKRIVVAVGAALAIGAAVFPSPAPAQGPPGDEPADLKAALRLRPDQEAAWRAYDEATASRPEEIARERAEAAELPRMRPPERLDRTARHLAEEQAIFARQAEAVRRLYRALSPEQQATFDRLTLPAPEQASPEP